MTNILIALGIVAYLVIGLLCSRWWYGRERSNRIDYYAEGGVANPVYYFDSYDRRNYVASSSSYLLAWPAFLAVFGACEIFVKVVTGSSTKSEYEKNQVTDSK